eukprot:345904-Prymnesium_polylepis.1
MCMHTLKSIKVPDPPETLPPPYGRAPCACRATASSGLARARAWRSPAGGSGSNSLLQSVTPIKKALHEEKQARVFSGKAKKNKYKPPASP